MPATDFLCILGVNGAGKTRLLRSIEQCRPEGDVMLVGTETLVDDMLWSLGHFRGIAEWRRRYTSVNTLMLDNFWVLASRPRAADVICHLIQDRKDAGKLTAVASDLPLTKWIEKNPGIARLLMEGTSIQLIRAGYRRWAMGNGTDQRLKKGRGFF